MPSEHAPSATVSVPRRLVTMPGTRPLPPSLPRGLWLALWLLLAGWLAAVVPATALAADEFLPPEQAFVVSARMVAPDRAEVSVAITRGYYLYREPFRFSADGARLGPALIPPGKVKFDENFQKNVETYRGTLHLAVPVLQAEGPFRLNVVSQGCADAGLCYPPMTTALRLDPAVLSAASIASTDAAATAATAADTAPWWEGGGVDAVLGAGVLWRAVLVFFGLGLLMTFTPCVLPMLPILSSLIVGSSGVATRGRGLALAATYSLGMALVYTLLGVAAGLAGEGLGAALQTPWVIGGFALLLVLLSLSMFDVYELRLPAGLTQRLSRSAGRLSGGQSTGVFLMGGLSALIVSPCVTAPLAGALLYIGRSGDVVLGGSALFAMAAGMSVPLLMLGASAGRWLPRAGAWMQTVKRLFGVLMLAVALWVAQPVLPVVAVMLLWGLLLLLLGMLLRPFSSRQAHHHPLRDGLTRAFGLAALALGLLQIVGAASGADDPLRPLARLGGAANARVAAPTFQVIHSGAELDQAIRDAAGRPVMLDFYADWCVSCKEMERFTFTDPAVAGRLHRAVLLKADVTANTADERALLRRFSLFGPPGTLFFDAQGHELPRLRVVGYQSARRFEQTLGAAGL